MSAGSAFSSLEHRLQQIDHEVGDLVQQAQKVRKLLTMCIKYEQEENLTKLYNQQDTEIPENILHLHLMKAKAKKLICKYAKQEGVTCVAQKYSIPSHLVEKWLFENAIKGNRTKDKEVEVKDTHTRMNINIKRETPEPSFDNFNFLLEHSPKTHSIIKGDANKEPKSIMENLIKEEQNIQNMQNIENIQNIEKANLENITTIKNHSESQGVNRERHVQTTPKCIKTATSNHLNYEEKSRIAYGEEFYPESTPCFLEYCSGCLYNALIPSLIHIPSSETIFTCTNINKCSNYGSVESAFQILQTFGSLEEPNLIIEQTKLNYQIKLVTLFLNRLPPYPKTPITHNLYIPYIVKKNIS